MKPLQKFARFIKIDEKKDGTLIVKTLITAEKPDLDDEVMDYVKSKPFWEGLVERRAAATSKVEGMETSYFPVREMHQLISAGTGIGIDFDDETKTITGTIHVTNLDSCRKVRSGTLIGASQGGRYVGRMEPDPTFTGCQRYICDPSEVSLVDAPCLPSALIESIKEATLTYVKADGSVMTKGLMSPVVDPIAENTDLAKRIGQLELALLKDSKTKRVAGEDLSSSAFLYVGDKDDTSTWKLPWKFSTDAKTQSHLRNALARFNQTEGIPPAEKAKIKRRLISLCKEHGIEVSEEASKMAKLLDDLKKGLYTVSQFAAIVDQTAWIRESVTWEREIEGDASTAPEEFTTLLEDMVSCLRNLVEEETAELMAATGGKKGEKVMDPKEKAALEKAVADAVEKAKQNMTTLLGHIEKAHAHHEKMEEHATKCAKAAGDLHELIGQHVDALGEALVSEKADGSMGMAKKCHKAAASLVAMHEAHGKMHEANGKHIENAMEACKACMGGNEPEKAVAEPVLTKAAEETQQILDALKTMGAEIAAVKESMAKAAADSTKEEPKVVPAVAKSDLSQILESVQKMQGELESVKTQIASSDPVHKVGLRLVGRDGGDIEPAKNPTVNLKETGI